MTRLADVTGLDRVGIPVWQAVRPWSKSVSVHQGKGLDAEVAQLGACMEAVECHHAENWTGEIRAAEFAKLPKVERLPALDDCARVRGVVGDDPIAWTRAERIGCDSGLWVPAAAVGLDACRARPWWIDCSSNGQGAGFDTDYASCKGLFEVIERDAYHSWLATSFVDRGRDGVAATSIRFEWFRTIDERLRALHIRIRLFALPAVVLVPVFVAEIIDLGPESRSLPFAHGICAHADAETALKGAIAEAAQSRLAEIAGARDDLELERPQIAGPRAGLALPMPRTVALQEFDRRFPARPAPTPTLVFAAAVEALSDAGYPVVGRIRLSPPCCQVTTIKMFVPGLAGRDRVRRGPVA